MTKVAVFGSVDGDGLPDLFDAAVGWCACRVDGVVTLKDEWNAAVTAVRFPAVLKPERGNGSLNVYAVDDEAGLRAALCEGSGKQAVARSNFQLGHGSGEAGHCLLEECLIGVLHPAGEWLGDHFSVDTLTFREGDH